MNTKIITIIFFFFPPLVENSWYRVYADVVLPVVPSLRIWSFLLLLSLQKKNGNMSLAQYLGRVPNQYDVEKKRLKRERLDTHSKHSSPLRVQLAKGSAHTNLPRRWKLWDPGNIEDMITHEKDDCLPRVSFKGVGLCIHLSTHSVTLHSVTLSKLMA